MDIPLPLNKLSLGSMAQDASLETVTNDMICVVLVSTGSFNPPTFMHLRMFELARDALNSEGYFVIGGYMSPVNDAYKKRGLISAEHRIQLCDLACKSSSFVMVDSWEKIVAKDLGIQDTCLPLCWTVEWVGPLCWRMPPEPNFWSLGLENDKAIPL